jgi:hypothetical protein
MGVACGAPIAAQTPPFSRLNDTVCFYFPCHYLAGAFRLLWRSSLEYLPQCHAATTLLEKYFTVVHPIWPFLAEEGTRR